MATKIDSKNLHASSHSALISTFLEFTSAAVVVIDESQMIVAFGGGAER